MLYCIFYQYQSVIMSKMLRILVTSLLLGLISAMETIHEVIIIGAGLSATSASRVLTDRGIPHLMLEARNRTGGRLHSATFQGLTVELGASFIHKPNVSNPLSELMRQLNETALAYDDSQRYLYEGPQFLDSKIQQVGLVFYDMLKAFVRFKAKMSLSDISVKDAAEDFFRQIMDREEPVYQDLVSWNLDMYGNVEGEDIQYLSARQFQIDESPYDCIPTRGYAQLHAQLFRKCNPELRLNEEVVEIDYTHQPVQVKTKKATYFAKKVINSIPLGVLQAGKVTFTPPLPEAYSTALLGIGQGSQNKLYVSFEQPFWDASQKFTWLYFMRKGKKRSDLMLALIYPQELSKGKHILVFFLSGKDNQRVESLAQAQLKKFVEDFLRPFAKKEPVVKSVLLTKWHLDPHSLGSYTYYRVGGSRLSVQTLRKPLRNKIWFVGEHTHPDWKSLAQAAYITGKEAALEIIDQERTRIKERLLE